MLDDTMAMIWGVQDFSKMGHAPRPWSGRRGDKMQWMGLYYNMLYGLCVPSSASAPDRPSKSLNYSSDSLSLYNSMLSYTTGTSLEPRGVYAPHSRLFEDEGVPSWWVNVGMEGGRLRGGKRGFKVKGWDNGFYRGDKRTRDDLIKASEGLGKILELFSGLLRYNYSITLLDIIAPAEGAGLYRVKELGAGKEDLVDGGVWGEFDDISLGNTQGFGWEGRGPAELLGATVDYNDEAVWLGPSMIGGRCLLTPISNEEQAALVEKRELVDTYEGDINGLRSRFSTVFRRGLHGIGMKGEVSVREERESFLVDVDPENRHGYEDPRSFEDRRLTLPPNAIAIVNLVKFCGDVDEHLEGAGELTAKGEMVAEMIRATGMLVRDGWGGGGTNHTQKVWGEDYEGGVGGEIVRGLRMEHSSASSPLSGLVSRVLIDPESPDSALFKPSTSSQRGWDILRGAVIESLLDMKRPLLGLEYVEKEFEGRNISFEAGCAAVCCASAQASIENFYGTGDAARMKEKCFESYERMQSECKEEMERMKELNHFNHDRMVLAMIRACEAMGDTDDAMSVLQGSRFASTSGDAMDNYDYVTFKSLAVASLLHSAGEREADLARVELVASNILSGPEESVLLTSDKTLSVYLKTLNALGMHKKGVETFERLKDALGGENFNIDGGWRSSACEMVTHLGKEGELGSAWDLVKDLDDLSSSSEAFERLSDVYREVDSPWGVIQSYLFADRKGMATIYLTRKAILSYAEMEKWYWVVTFGKLLSAKTGRRLGAKKGRGGVVAGVSARERRGKGTIQDHDFGWVNNLLGNREWVLGEGKERKEVIHAIVKAGRKLELEKLLLFFLKTAEKGGEALEGKTIAAVIDACGFRVRRRRKGGCRGEPVFEDYRDLENEEWEKKLEEGRKNLKKVLAHADRMGEINDDDVMAAASRAWRALGKPYQGYEIIRKSMKSQKIPQPSVFAQTIMGALETNDEDLVNKVMRLHESSGYDFDLEVYRRKEAIKRYNQDQRRQRFDE